MRTLAIAAAVGAGFVLSTATTGTQVPRVPQVRSKPLQMMRAAPQVPFFTFVNNSPDNRHTDWTGDLQGVAHDDHNWFFTQAISGDKEDWLIKIPIARSLFEGIPSARGAAGVLSNRKTAYYPHLNAWWHMGDLAQLDGYLFVPMIARAAGQRAIVGLFKASDLTYAHHAEVPDSPAVAGGAGTRRETNIGWCAVRRSGASEGLLYTSSSSLVPGDPIDVYRFDLGLLRKNQLVLSYARSLTLLDECGRPMSLMDMQGGEFSTDGRWLILTNGYCDLKNSSAGCWGREGSESEGLMVFDTQTGVRVAKAGSGTGLFDYEYHYIGSGGYAQEPEGVTYWDLDADTRAPGIRGQLHAILLNNNTANADSIFFKHYRLEPALTAAEDLAPLDRSRAAVERYGSGWRIAAGGAGWFTFAREADANQALRVLQRYAIDTVGYVGRPGPSLTYLLSGGRAPSGAVEGETCTAFDPAWLLVRRESSRWDIVQGTTAPSGSACRQIFSFEDAQEREARAAFGIVKKYGFTHACRVGGVGSTFSYLRR